MKILVVGGGSGGHVTPALAILESLATHDPSLKVVFVCDKKFAPQAKVLLSGATMPIKLRTIWAGKLRRYHGVPLWKQLLDIPTIILNIRDLFFIAIGLLQSLWILGDERPAVVFGKGGFVCLPMGFAAHLARVPLVLHDSDMHPGLTNRILAPWATAIATGAPLENYNYDAHKARYVGIPVDSRFTPLGAAEVKKLRAQLGYDAAKTLVVVVGGGLGAQSINTAMAKSAAKLLDEGVEIVHVAGAAHSSQVQRQLPQQAANYHVRPFVDSQEMRQLLQVADIVVSRAGATAIAELAILGKPTILVPGAHLTGGQQVKNAGVLAADNAAIVLTDAQITNDHMVLQEAILELKSNTLTRHDLSKRIVSFAKPEAAADTAQIILSVTRRQE